MSTRLLYHAWGLRGYGLIHTRFQHGIVRLGIEAEPERIRCGGCGSTEVQKAGTVPRQFRTLPIGGKPVWINLSIQRVRLLRQITMDV